MADRVEAFDVTVPAGTLQSAPLEFSTLFPPGELLTIEVIIPDGVNGLAAFQIAAGHQRVIPYSSNTFIRGNDEKISWPISTMINSGQWSVIAYNADVFDHTFQVRYLIDEIGGGIQSAIPIIMPVKL